jgi:exopolysaccharide biosynthesis predicted pyruvyltransferase EpsI
MFNSGDAYFRFLTGQRGKVFYLYPYVGNSGDSLIRMGSVRLLADLEIASTLDPRKADVILWPGGNPTMWRANVDGWRAVLKRYTRAEFIVGPATIQYSEYDWVSVILRHADRVRALFARDPASYQKLVSASLPDSVEIGLGHDPALYLRGSDWLTRRRAAATEDYVLVAFRADHEGCAGLQRYGRLVCTLLPPRLRRYVERKNLYRSRNRKVKNARERAIPGYPLRIADVAAFDFDSFVDGVLRAKEVHTDRLHTMLLAAMLGKQVFAYSTSYGKLEAVYEHSVKDWAHVDFVQDRSSTTGNRGGLGTVASRAQVCR